MQSFTYEGNQNQPNLLPLAMFGVPVAAGPQAMCRCIPAGIPHPCATGDTRRNGSTNAQLVWPLSTRQITLREAKVNTQHPPFLRVFLGEAINNCPYLFDCCTSKIFRVVHMLIDIPIWASSGAETCLSQAERLQPVQAWHGSTPPKSTHLLRSYEMIEML